MRRFLGFTWIGWLNLLVLQWFWLRLYRVEDNRGRVTIIGVNGWVLPLTGWRSEMYPRPRAFWPLWRAQP